MTVKIDKGEQINSANVYFIFEKRPLFFNYEVFGYLHRKNRIDLSMNLTKYDAFKF
jgi:hypothetical protein